MAVKKKIKFMNDFYSNVKLNKIIFTTHTYVQKKKRIYQTKNIGKLNHT